MMEPVNTALGSAIRKHREAAGITQDALAARVHLSRTSVTNVERGRQAISVYQLLLFCRALDADPVDILSPAVAALSLGKADAEVPADMEELLARLGRKS